MDIQSFACRIEAVNNDIDSDGECSDNSLGESISGLPQAIKYENNQVAQDAQNKRRTNNIWSEVIMDQHITTQLGTVAYIDGLKRTLERGPECYPLPHKISNKSKNIELNSKKFTKNKNFNKIKISKEEIDKFSEQSLCQRRKHVIYRLKKNDGYQKFYTKLKLTSDMDFKLAIDIISKYLCETNLTLLEKIISNVGLSKAMEVLCETDAIQKMGGVYTLNGDRKRTFGGVYILMVKIDFGIPKEVKNILFGKADGSHKLASTENVSQMQVDDPSVHKEDDADSACGIEDIPDDVSSLTNGRDCGSSLASTTDDNAPQKMENGDREPTDGACDLDRKWKRKRNNSKKRNAPKLPVEIRNDNKFFYMNDFGKRNRRGWKNGNNTCHGKGEAVEKEKAQTLSQ